MISWLVLLIGVISLNSNNTCLDIDHSKRVLEYGVLATLFYGNLREQTGENGFPRIPTGVGVRFSSTTYQILHYDIL